MPTRWHRKNLAELMDSHLCLCVYGEGEGQPSSATCKYRQEYR
jgi:hypothetical protein